MDGQGQAAQGPAVGAAGAGGPLGSARDSDTIPAVPAAPPAGEAAGLAQDPRFAPYARARLQPWLDSAEATAGGGAAAGPGAVASGAWAPAAPPGPAGPAGGSAADSLGTGPCSALDISLAGFELCVPFDREPGPCQRYAELYFKALQLVSLVGGRLRSRLGRGPAMLDGRGGGLQLLRACVGRAARVSRTALACWPPSILGRRLGWLLLWVCLLARGSGA